jgi:hypothetical protein
MKAELSQRYKEEWDALVRNQLTNDVGGDKPSNPLLLDAPPSYFAANYRVMIFGQETNDWAGTFPHVGSLDQVLKVYRDFFTNGECYSYGGHFWNGTSRLMRDLEAHLRPSGKTIAVIWNNLIKIGKAKVGEKPSAGTPNDAILNWEDRWFDVISFEVSELNPNLVIFFTGPNYDRFISRSFGDAVFEAINARPVRQLARIKSCGLPVDSIRTYHPNYLWRNGFHQYLTEILDAVRF